MGPRSRPTSPSASTLPSSATGSPPASGTPAKLRVVPIGIPDGGPDAAAAGLIDAAVLAELPQRGAESTKFSSGQVVVVGGSRGLTGAVCLSAEAATRTGAGYATVAVPADLEPIFEAKLTEVMSVGCASREGRLRRAASEQVLGVTEGAAAVVLGPGIGREDGTKDLVRDLAQRIESPLVIDADGLNAHAGRIEKLHDRRSPDGADAARGRARPAAGGGLRSHQGQAARLGAGGGPDQRGDRGAEGRRHDRHRRQTRRRQQGRLARLSPRPAPATSSRGSRRRSWLAAWTRSRRSAPRCSRTRAPGGWRPSGSGRRSR